MNLLLNSVPENPTLIWALVVAVSGLVTAIVYLYKQSEKWRAETDKLRDKHEERLLVHATDMRVLVEKTLIAFNEIEKKIFEASDGGTREIRETIVESQTLIVGEMKSISEKLNRQNGSNDG